MTAVPEAELAREAETAYATVAGVTDYDVWKGGEVTLEEVLENAECNRETVSVVVEQAIRPLPVDRTCDCHEAVAGTVNTPTEAIPAAARERIELLRCDYV